MPVLIDGHALTPAPLVTITPNIIDTGAGIRLGTTYDIVLRGTLTAVPPGSFSETDTKLGQILDAQDQLIKLFKTDGKTLEIYSKDGTGLKKCTVRLKSGPEFAEGNWVDTVGYTITLEADTLYPDEAPTNYFITEATDNWELEESGVHSNNTGFHTVYKITHNISAKGKTHYEDNNNLLKQAWEQARDWVLNQLNTTSIIANRPFDTKSELGLSALQPYNHSKTESVDILDGSFSIQESWLLTYGGLATEDYTINVKETPEGSSETCTVTINGTIHGHSDLANDINTKNINAQNYYLTVVKPVLYVRAQAAATWTTLSDYGTSGSLDYNKTEGTISYSFDYTDRPSSTDHTVYDTYTVTKKTSLSAYETTITVAGTITGRLHLEEPNASLLKYQRAKTYLDSLLSGTTFLQRAKQSGVAGLKSASLEGSIDHNFYEGTINYSFDYSDRPFNTVKNDYNRSYKYNSQDGSVSVTVEGTIEGLKTSDSDPYTVKYENALAFWSTWEPGIFSLATSFPALSGSSLNSVVLSKSRGDNPLNGTIQYSYEYGNAPANQIPGSLSESISINYGGATEVFASIPVLGDPDGPVLQDIGTVTAKTKSVNLEYQMQYGSGEPDVSGIINGYQPAGKRVFKSRDEHTWSPRNFHGSASAEWTYV